DSVSLFEHTSGASLTPPATADSATRSQWLTRDAAARLAVRNHLPFAERAHFGHHMTAKALYDAVVAHYSSPATAALGRLLLPHLFPELSAFATIEDLVTHLRTSNARYRAALPAEFVDRNPPPMYITLYFIVTRLPDSLRAVRDHILALDPTALTVDLLDQHLLAAETSVVAQQGQVWQEWWRWQRGGGGGRSGGGGGSGGGGSGESGGGSGGFGGGGGGNGGGGGSGSSGSGGSRSGAVPRGGSGGGQRQQQQRRTETPSPQQLREWFSQRWASGGSVSCPSGVDIFALDYDAILAAMYALSVSAEGDCYLCVPPDPGIEAAALGASESALPGTAPAEALHTFTLDSGAFRCLFRDSTSLTPLPAPVPVRLAGPLRGPGLARYSTVLPCPAVPSGALSGLHLPSFSTNLVSTAALQDAMVTTTTPGGQRVSICTCTRTGRHLAPFTRRPGLSLYTLATEPPQVSASTPAPACPALPSLRRGAAARRSSLLLVSPDDSSPADSPYGHRGGEFSSDLLWDLSRGEGILQTFTLPASPQQNGIAERRIGLVMEVVRTSMIHAAAPHFLWPFAVRYAAYQLNLWPRVSLPETSPTLHWTGKVGDASVFRVWGSRAFVRDTSVDKLSASANPCIFLGFPLDAPGWQFYHPTSRCVLPSQEVTFDKLIPFYRLFPYRSAPLPPPPLFLAPGTPPVDPLPPQGPAPSGVSQVDPLPGTVPVEVAVDSGAARGAASGGAEPVRVEPRGSEPAGAEPGGAKCEGAGVKHCMLCLFRLQWVSL
ncbi:unnamed protein product, partial [Closterium sp. NIES-53]